MFDEPESNDEETITSLRAERDHYKDIVETGLEPKLKSFRYGDGEFSAELTGQAVEMMSVAFVSQFKAGGAANFMEMSLFDKAEPFQRYTLTVQKVGALSPADKLRIAESRVAELEAALAGAAA